jgi:nitrite reductase/ring-hydroxylating ferredoxin subunit
MVLVCLLVLHHLRGQQVSDSQDQPLACGHQLHSRRALLAGACVAGAAALAGCTTYDANNGGIAGPPPSSAAPASQAAAGGATGSSGAGGTGAASAAPANQLASTADVPVGGGKIISGVNVVLTQPVAGTFKGFSAVCTHQGCIVATIANGTIDCPCHGSKFSVKDGSVVNGPAASPLPPVKITVQGTSILKG